MNSDGTKGPRSKAALDAADAAAHEAEAREFGEDEFLGAVLEDLDPRSIDDALRFAGQAPSDTDASSAKIPYATKFSALVAKAFCTGLKQAAPDLFAGIRAGEEQIGEGTVESKKIDVLLSHTRKGMMLNISIKTQSFRDNVKGRVKQTKSYCHNITRVIDQELQLEAMKSHRLFPYAVLLAVVVFPANAWFDADPKWKSASDKQRDGKCSSAAEFAQRLRLISGRRDIRDPDQEARFEHCFIAAHGLGTLPDDLKPRGFSDNVAFFHVDHPVPRFGLPQNLMTYDEFLLVVTNVFNNRWNERRQWDETAET